MKKLILLFVLVTLSGCAQSGVGQWLDKNVVNAPRVERSQSYKQHQQYHKLRNKSYGVYVDGMSVGQGRFRRF